MKPIYVAGTLQDSGKTSVSLGLMQALIDRGYNPGYMKPVGQRYIKHFGQSIDEDAYLFSKVFRLPDRMKLMSPVAIKRNFTRDFIRNPNVESLERAIIRCTQRIQRNHDALVIEGTGHAGVGSCFGLSNARVAQLLGAKVIIVGKGGIGKPIDEIGLNLALFRQFGIEVIGAIINKVIPRKFDEINDVVSRGLPIIGTSLLGSIPYVSTLTYYTVEQVAEEFGYQVIAGARNLQNVVEKTVVLAMKPEHSAKYIRKNTLVLTPADRSENIRTAITTLKSFAPSNGGIILTGASKVDRETLALVHGCDIPILTTKDDTFSASSNLVHLEFKIQSSDTSKIDYLRSLVGKHIDIDAILRSTRE